MKIFDYYCSGCDDFETRLVDGQEDKQICRDCNIKMERQFPAPMGYVRGTNNPTKR